MKPLLTLLTVMVFMVTPNAHALTVTYTLDSVTLEGGAPMKGTFLWTFAEGDFENGMGQFTFLEIPWTSHDHTDLTSTFDIGSSIEITLVGSVHDDGVDITLVLEQPLTPTTSSPLLLGMGNSKYEIGGNGFHDGLVQSGRISPIPEPSLSLLLVLGLGVLITKRERR